MSYKYLNKINSPADLKALGRDEVPELCSEIREFLIDKVSKQGGHLASNLGATELSVAIHRVFDSPKDHIIFDVGHQSYVHKIITGRRDRFDELRVPGGLSGFTTMRESDHDAFGAGHSSTSMSAALGFAEGDKLLGNDNFTVCVIGDGAYTGGMIHEAINNCKPDLRLIVILNENGMSISTNKGAFASYLSAVRMSRGYLGVKETTESILSRIPVLGKPLRSCLSWIKNTVKRFIFKPNYFEDLGFYYLGPIDGNDYNKVENALVKAKKLNKCVFIHLKTQKGKGCEDAELAPEVFHSITGSASGSTYHSEFAEELISLAEEDKRVVAITAAMGVGTGLSEFGEKYSDRYFDVGIAEEHALTFAAGLAANGYKPFAAIYSTFLQRGYDNIIHDIALQNLPVKILIDRAGIAVHDGATHHGIFDVAFLSHIPGMEILAPATFESLRRSVRYAKDAAHPVAIRYANSPECIGVKDNFEYFGDETSGLLIDFDVENAPEKIFITYGKQVERVIEAKRILNDGGINVGIILVERIKPMSLLIEILEKLSAGRHLIVAEEGIRCGGFGMTLVAELAERGALTDSRLEVVAIDDNFVLPDKVTDVYDYVGLSPKRLALRFLV